MAAQEHGVPKDWSLDSIGSLKNQVIVVTGANAGIGYETSLALAKKGALVVLACRNAERAKAAAEKIEFAIKDIMNAGSVEIMLLDTSSLASVRAFSTEFQAKHSRLDVLINNAGVFTVPCDLTADGTERHFATNHLGHFVLTFELLGVLKASAPSRIVNVSSNNHRFVSIVPREKITMMNTSDHSSTSAYSLTKLYNMVFTKELGRRLVAAGINNVKAVACHPGVTSTNVLSTAATNPGLDSMFWRFMTWTPFYQKASIGALPAVYAATASNIQNGDYYGPWFFGLWGSPVLEKPAATTDSREFAHELWEESENVAGFKFLVQ